MTITMATSAGIGPAADPISERQASLLLDLIDDVGANEKRFRDFFKIDAVADLPLSAT